MIRTTRRNLIASARIDYLDSKNALFGSTIAAEITWTASGSLAFRLGEDRTVVGARLGGAKGLDFAGARVDQGVGEADFAYVDASVEANQAIGKAFVARAAATGR